MIGRTLGHYRIVEKIDAGGMGEVYRARDEHLNRDVALKVLPPGLLDDEAARRRFRKEALALSKLNHPNIETVHDFDTQDGVDFLVMEYIPGVTLSDRAGQPGSPLAEKEVVRLGVQLAEGLAAAHGEGIVHRDLKPGNLRVTPDSRLKILDFGLAKLTRPTTATATTESLSETEARAGTPLYMAPEQQRGEKADARTDIYAAGLVLLQMATGELPLVRGRGLAGKTSPDLERILGKCLEDDPELRYQSAKELLVDLRRLGSPAIPAAGAAGLSFWVRWRYAVVAGVSLAILLGLLLGLNVGGLRNRWFGAGPPALIDSIAVLPLKNLMNDPTQDYFVEGMHEALTAELSKISALKVISRTSTMRYKDTDKPMPQIARELGVTGLIEGSVLREGDQVRITVQLIHGPRDRHLWADSYQRELRGVLALQSEVAQGIAREIKVRVDPAEAGRLARTQPVNAEAYDAYLKGLYYQNQFGNTQEEEPLRTSVEYLEQSITLDPSLALARAGVSYSYSVLASLGHREFIPSAKQAATKALELDDGLAEAHAALALTKYMFDWDWQGADKEFRRAVELNPGGTWVRFFYAVFLRAAGRYQEALAEFKRSEEVDPFTLPTKANIADAYYCSRRYDQAIEQLRKTLLLSPDSPWMHAFLGDAYIPKGMYREAEAELNKALELSGGDPRFKKDLAYLYAVSGRRNEAVRIVKEFSRPSSPAPWRPVEAALIYCALGDKEQAFGLLETAYEERSPDLPAIQCGPDFDNLRGDPRFQDLLRRMNLPAP